MKLEEPEFESVMTEIDEKLSEDEIAIPSRPIHAAIELLKRYKISAPLFHPWEKDLGFPVTGSNASDHVHSWYSNSYGELLNVDFSPASFPIFLKGHCYEVKLPFAIGGFTLVSSKHNFPSETIINGVDYIQKLPKIVRNSLTGLEENTIQAMYATCLGVADEFKKHRTELVRSARNDSILSCELLCGFNKNPSMSAWHSLQFAEKCIKEFIGREARFSRIHDIEALRQEAINVGYTPDPRLNWELFEFGPSVRYEPDAVNMEDAVKINHEAWRVAFNTLKQVKA